MVLTPGNGPDKDIKTKDKIGDNQSFFGKSVELLLEGNCPNCGEETINDICNSCGYGIEPSGKELKKVLGKLGRTKDGIFFTDSIKFDFDEERGSLELEIGDKHYKVSFKYFERRVFYSSQEHYDIQNANIINVVDDSGKKCKTELLGSEEFSEEKFLSFIKEWFPRIEH